MDIVLVTIDGEAEAFKTKEAFEEYLMDDLGFTISDVEFLWDRHRYGHNKNVNDIQFEIDLEYKVLE